MTFTSVDETDPNRLNALVSMANDAGIIVLDAVHGDMTNLYVRMKSTYKESVVIGCTSYQSGNFSNEQSAKIQGTLRLSVDSWTWDEYIAAFHLGLIPNISTMDSLSEHYYYAGGCMRLLTLLTTFSTLYFPSAK